MAGEGRPGPGSADLPGRGVGGLPGWLRERLLERREIVLQGELDELCATQVSAELAALEVEGDERIRLWINSAGGSLGAASTLMETCFALGVPVEAVCTGVAQGPALGILAAARWRYASAHSRLRMEAPEVSSAGSGTQIVAAAEQQARQVDAFVTLLARATGQPAERVEVDLRQRRYFEIEEAIAYRLIDDVWRGRA